MTVIIFGKQAINLRQLRTNPKDFSWEVLVGVFRDNRTLLYTFCINTTIIKGSTFLRDVDVPHKLLNRFHLIHSSQVTDDKDPFGFIDTNKLGYMGVYMWMNTDDLETIGFTELRHDPRRESKSES